MSDTMTAADLFAELAADIDPVDALELASAATGADPAELTAELATHPDLEVRRAVAQLPGLDTATQDLLAADNDPHTRRLLAANSDCDTAVLCVLAGDDDPNVVDVAVRHPNLDPAVLAAHLDAGGPSALAALDNPSAPVDRVAALLDRRSDLAAAIADGAALDDQLSAVLAAHPDRDVRLRLAGNHAAAATAVAGLVADDDLEVSTVATETMAALNTAARTDGNHDVVIVTISHE